MFPNTPDATIRRDQAQFARRITVNPGVSKGKFIAKGHDALLQEAQHAKTVVKIVAQSGETIEGVIVKRDKWTVTIAEVDRTASDEFAIVYKHAIETVRVKLASLSSESH